MTAGAEPQVVVVGAGCVGASTALHLANQGVSVHVMEKEPAPAMHQSGRNSGVIHAGYNLKTGSMKARFCVEGSRAMRAFCSDHDVPVEQGGILVVASTTEQAAQVDALHDQGKANGVQVDRVDDAGIRRIEPNAVGVAALHAPEGSSVDAAAYVRALVREAESAGAQFSWSTRFDPSHVPAGAVVVNAAGLHADRVAAALCPDMRIIPFRGSYARLRPDARQLVRSHIYAAPDPRFPFLGVHLSKRVNGDVAVGPGALLACGREAYHPLHVQPDFARTLAWPGFWRMLGTPSFRAQVRSEIRKSVSIRGVWREAKTLVPSLRRMDVRRGTAAMAGNRAQMVLRDGALVDDIVVRETEDAVHVLNAVSPGLTCSLPFGHHLAQRAAAKL